MKSIFNIKFLYGLSGAAFLLLAFNNCGEGFTAANFGSGGIGLGGSASFSRAPGETCEDALLKVYTNSFHPFLSQTCNACHINGPGLGAFASPNAAISYASFSSIGAEKVSNQAINDAHKPPFTGPQNAGRIDQLKAAWASAQESYLACSTEANGGVNPSSFVVKSTDRQVNANLGTNFVRMEWDLETQSDAKVPLVVGIDIRRAVIANVTQGYEFRNPTLRVKNAAAGNWEARALNIYINGVLQTEVTTYSNLNIIVGSTTDLNLSPGTANALAVMTPAASDRIAVEFSKLGSTTGAPNPGTPAGPNPSGPTPTPIGNVTFAQLAANGGLFANSCFSCHRAGNAQGGLDMTNYNNSRLAAQNIKSRVNNPNNPMPTGSLLPQNQRDIISAWVDQGAPP